MWRGHRLAFRISVRHLEALLCMQGKVVLVLVVFPKIEPGGSSDSNSQVLKGGGTSTEGEKHQNLDSLPLHFHKEPWS